MPTATWCGSRRGTGRCVVHPLHRRANKPKALSAPTECKGANVEGVARRARCFVKQNSTLPSGSESQTDAVCSRRVTTCRFRSLPRHFLARATRSDRKCRACANWCRVYANECRASDNECTASDKSRHTAPTDQRSGESSTLRVERPRAVGSRNFLGGKTDNKEWPERLAQANLRVHRAPCRSTRASNATNSASDVRTIGSPHPSGAR
jgi:hypothetical protein